MKYKIFFYLFAITVFFAKAQNIKLSEINSFNINVDSNDNLGDQTAFMYKYLDKLLPNKVGINSLVKKNKFSINLSIAKSSKNKDLFINCEEESFYIEVNKNYVNIVGNSKKGVEFGIYEFLQSYIGIDWLFPGELGEYIPNKERIIIPIKNTFQNPQYKSRQLSPIDLTQKNDLSDWGNQMKLIDKISFHHNMNFYIKDVDISSLNPNFFISSTKGNNYKPKDNKDIQWQPNFKSEEFLKYSIDKVKKYFDKNDVKTFSLGINDNYLADKSYTKINEFGFTSYSEDYYNWANKLVNEVSKIYPNKKYGLLSYYNVSDPPNNYILNKDIIPFLTYERIRWSNNDLKNLDQKRTNQWQQHAIEIGWYDYLYGYTYLLPRVFNKTMQESILWASKNNVAYYYAEIYPNWGEGPKYWLLTKLLWNPNLDIEVEKLDWYNKAVGEAASVSLKQYYDIWEKYWQLTLVDKKWFLVNSTFMPFNDLGYLEYVTNEMVNNSEKLLLKTINDAQTQTQKQRAQMIYKMWTLYKIAINEYKNNKIKYIYHLKNSKEFKNKLKELKNDRLFINTATIIEKNMNQ